LELGDRRDALRAQLDLEMQALDARRDQLDAEWEATQAVFERRLSNAKLYAEARLILERGVNEQLIQDLWKYEKEFGEGMGILGDYVKTRLTQQILVAEEALQNLAHNVRIATDQDLFQRVLNGEGITIRDVFGEMFNPTRLDDVVKHIQDNIEKFAYMSDEGMFDFIQHQFGELPIFAKEAIADVLRELSKGKIDIQEAFETIFNLPIENADTAFTTGLGAWQLDENKTQVLFEMIDKITNAQVDNIETLIDLYDEDYRKFSEAQQRKLLSVRRLHDEVVRSSGDMFTLLSSNMTRWVGNVESVLNQIGQAIHQLTAQLNVITQITAQTQTNLLSSNPNVKVNTNQVPVPRFATGGLNRGAGLRFLDPDEQVLTAEQTKAFSELVFGLGSDGMRNITDGIRKANVPSTNMQSGKILEANFNFNAGVTQEALPEVKRMLNSAIYELKGEIPNIVATEQRDSMRRMGGR